MFLRPLVAYELGEIDAARGKGTDEGIRRMKPLRAAIRATAAPSQRAQFVLPESKGCFATHIVGRLPPNLPPVAARSMREAIVHSLLSSSAAYDDMRPTVRLVQPQVRTCGPAEADLLDEVTRRRCVPIQDYACVAIPDHPPVGDDAKPYVEVCWPRALGARAQVPSAAKDAHMRVVWHSPTTVAYHFVDFGGCCAPTLVADLPSYVVSQLFEHRSTDAPPPPRRRCRERLPVVRRRAGGEDVRELPDFLVEALAGFCQQMLRLHVVASLSSPVLTGRAFALNRGEYVSKRPSERGRSQQPLALCLRVHATTSVCLCPAHNLPPMAARSAAPAALTDNSDVILMVRMCGLEADGDHRCPQHRTGCGNGVLHDVCCANTSVELRCRHFTEGGGGRGRGGSETGLAFKWTRHTLPPHAWETLTTILAHTAAYERLFEPARVAAGEPPPPPPPARPTSALLRDAEAALAADLERVEDARARAVTAGAVPRDEELVRLDHLAMEQLMRGELGRIEMRGPGRGAPASRAAPGAAASCRLGLPDGRTGKGKPATPALRRLEPYHGALFPAPGRALHRRVFDDELGDAGRDDADDADDPDDRASAAASASFGGLDADPDVDDTETTASGSNSAHKRRRVGGDAPPADPDTLEEFIDVGGVAEARRQLEALLATDALSTKQRERAQFFYEFLEQIVQNFEPGDVDGPREFLCRRLYCVYRRKAAIGRLYTSNTKTMPDWSKDDAPRAICLQGAPKELRPFLCARLCRDYDLKNAQPQLLRQLASQLVWHPPRAPPALPELANWCDDRDAFIAHVAEVHALAADADRWEDYRKDEVKELVISLIFGGAYEGWLRKRGFDTAPKAPRSPKIVRLQAELAALREAVFTSLRWAPHVAEQRERLRRIGKKETEAEIDRSVFALIAQSEEDRILAAMRRSADAQGFQILSLQFDGFFVREKPGRYLDLAVVATQIERDTGYTMQVVEKPLHSDVWPTLSLVRAGA